MKKPKDRRMSDKALREAIRRSVAHAEPKKDLIDRIEELEAKLAQGTIVEYDDGSRVSLSAFAGGASENGAWSHLTLMKEERDGAVSFRHYTADGGWCSPRVSSTLAELKGENQ
jgi:hypothetical protein